MHGVSDYLAKAEQAERLALTMINPSDKASLQEIAAEWRRLAEQAGRLAEAERGEAG